MVQWCIGPFSFLIQMQSIFRSDNNGKDFVYDEEGAKPPISQSNLEKILLQILATANVTREIPLLPPKTDTG